MMSSLHRPLTRSRTRAQGRPSLVTFLGIDAAECILQHLEADDYFAAAATCRALRQLALQPSLLARLPLGRTEDATFPPERQRLLARLADAGNASACYRLGVMKVYHPALINGATDQGPVWVEEGKSLLSRAIELDDGSVRADAAFELWLLTRRLPGSNERCETLLQIASAAGHNPARFGMHRPRSQSREPNDFRVSDDFAAAQELLVCALVRDPPCPSTTSKCRNPNCGRWGVRARARLHGLSGPPALPRCQGVHGGHCKTRYCSRFCQAIHWPEHRKECSLPVHP